MIVYTLIYIKFFELSRFVLYNMSNERHFRMTLSAEEHQKIAVLQQAARLVSQAASVAHNPEVLKNVANNLLPLVERYQGQDPRFTELAILLRQARVSTSPHTLYEIIGAVNSMTDEVQMKLPERKNAAGERVAWDPIRGNYTSPRFEQNEPVTLMTAYDDWRGSKKHPYGKAFPDWNSMMGVEEDKNLFWVGLGLLLWWAL